MPVNAGGMGGFEELRVLKRGASTSRLEGGYLRKLKFDLSYKQRL